MTCQNLLAAVLAVGFCFVLHGAESKSSLQNARVLKKTVKHRLQLEYLVNLPPGYSLESGKRWPLMIFLHGSGERGTNLTLVKKWGPPKLVDQQPDFPFVLVSPQCPMGRYWLEEEVMTLLDEVENKYRVDRKRVYLTGLSMGAYAVWQIATLHPERFAAIVPICGGGDSDDVDWMKEKNPKVYSQLAVWAFHGAKDQFVPLAESEWMVDAFKKAGAKEVKFTVYPDLGHDCFTNAYANPALYDWFLQQRLK
jgi:predicted peptidase